MCESADPVLTSVHPQETTVERAPTTGPTGPEDLPTDPDTFRHSGWQPLRARVAEAFIAKHETDHPDPSDVTPNDRFRAFWLCGSKAYVVVNPTNRDEIGLRGNYCHDRFCLPCTTAKARLIADTLYQRVQKKPHRFITLTVETSNETLSDSIKKLWASFKRLRNRPFWRSHVYGGVAFLEVKHNANAKRWHPHLHVLVEGKYLEHTQLKTEWCQVTGGSFIVDIRFVRDSRACARYVSKYVTKGWHHSCFDDMKNGAECIAALHGRRLSTTFGSWRGFVLTPEPKRERWDDLLDLQTLLQEAQTGCPHAIWCVRSLRGETSLGRRPDRLGPREPERPPKIEAQQTFPTF